MPEYEYVIVDVSPMGEVSVKTEGFAGKACLEATHDLEESLGQVTYTIPTLEMYKPEIEVTRKNVTKQQQ